MNSETERYNDCEEGEKSLKTGLGRGLGTLLGDRNKRTSYGLGKGLGVLIGGYNKHTSSSDKK